MPDKLIITFLDVKEEIEKQTDKRFSHHRNLIYGVLIVVGVGFITMVAAAFSIFINHQDYTSQRYNEYIRALEAQQNFVKKTELTIVKKEEVKPKIPLKTN